MRNYNKVIYWSTKDNTFITEVPELLGCMTDGQTRVEAVKNTEITTGELIETAQSIR